MGEVHRFRGDIQGLRALAIVPVVIYHAIESWMPGGFVGVDIFFVISGYLITSILTRDLENNSFSIVGFYQRRVKRLFPALFVVLLFTLILGVILLPPDDLEGVAKASIATTLFGSNILFWRTTDYFAEQAEMMPLLHTWSLSVEEQFYFAFPIILWVIHRYLPSYLKSLLWAGAAISLFVCVWLLESSPSAAFYLPVTRAYELLLGSLLAVKAIPPPEGKGPRCLIGRRVGNGVLLFGISKRYSTISWHFRAMAMCGSNVDNLRW